MKKHEFTQNSVIKFNLTCSECALTQSMQPCEACPNYRVVERGTINYKFSVDVEKVM